jgi:23S rRNA (cytidine1920-2'-O)/16S rRNA (cytidine1409-2'-O)-methyltransferase
MPNRYFKNFDLMAHKKHNMKKKKQAISLHTAFSFVTLRHINMEERLDKILVQRQFAASRERAKSLIESGKVLVDKQMVLKPGRVVSLSSEIELLEKDIPWVSRGALKLLKALEAFDLDPAGQVCLDIGASTGGFTEVLLSKSAERVYCVDVGHDQLAATIKNDPRVINMERTHVNSLSSRIIPDACGLCVIDVSFISLTKVLPFLPQLLSESASIIALIKPQFEVGKANLNSKGIVKSKLLYPSVIESISECARRLGFETQGLIDSPILGGDGNKEFLVLLQREEEPRK